MGSSFLIMNNDYNYEKEFKRNYIIEILSNRTDIELTYLLRISKSEALYIKKHGILLGMDLNQLFDKVRKVILQ